MPGRIVLGLGGLVLVGLLVIAWRGVEARPAVRQTLDHEPGRMA